tara:strand:+ start:406 stop:582 length:177 start_codon:yes stop_codon:yes gene_type:complete
MDIKIVKKYNQDGEWKNAYIVTLNNSSDVMSVPHDEANTDYQDILKWVEDGNTIKEAD